MFKQASNIIVANSAETDAAARVTNIDDCKEFLDYFQHEGYDEVDTARSYVGGKQEAFTREAGWKNRGLKLATKVYPAKGKAFSPGRILGMHKPELLMEEFNTSLRELGTNCVDIFYLHAADRSEPFAQTLEAVDKLHKE